MRVVLSSAVTKNAELKKAAERLASKVLTKTPKDRINEHVKKSTLRTRGWIERDIENTLQNPVSVSKSGENAVVFWKNTRDHIVVLKKSKEVLQVSNRKEYWNLDSRIEYPFPGKYPVTPLSTPTPPGPTPIRYDWDEYDIGGFA